MALFGKKKKEIGPEEQLAREENRKKLENFTVTKAWGVKKYQIAMQFIYDKEKRQFVVVEGPEDTFREREPWVVDFDQVTGVFLEVEENWTEEKNEYALNGRGNLLLERYDEVWWKYEFFITIQTTHPYAGDIRFKTNFKPNFVQVPSRGLFARRGLEMNGKFVGAEISALVEKMDTLLAEEPVAIKRKKTVDILTGNRPDGVLGKLKEDFTYDMYLKTLENIQKHIKRADNIRKLLGQ